MSTDCVRMYTGVCVSADCAYIAGEPELDVHFHGGLPSFFARAYHSRPSQTTGADLEQHAATARTLPEHHPLLVRHADHPQQLTSRAVGGPSIHVDPPSPASGSANQVGGVVGGAMESPHHESAMHQLLSNISVAAGTNEVLGFGVMPGTTHRNRGEKGEGGGGGEPRREGGE